MSDLVEIPRGKWHDETAGPCWFPVTSGGKPAKPLIQCQCGQLTGIGLHHVHADGRVTASFFHQRGDVAPADPKGCGWHVFLKLIDYDCGDFPPEK